MVIKVRQISEAQRIHLKKIAKLPRPNSKGGYFRDKEAAKKYGKIGGSQPKHKRVNDMSNFIQVEYSFWNGSKTDTDIMIINIEKVIAIYIGGHSLNITDVGLISLTSRGWEVLMNAIQPTPTINDKEIDDSIKSSQVYYKQISQPTKENSRL